MYLAPKTIPHRTKQNAFRICSCERCGENLIAYERDARELAAIFEWQIRKENLWITRIRRALVHSLGGQL